MLPDFVPCADGKKNAGKAASDKKDTLKAKQPRVQNGQGRGAGLLEAADGDGTRAAPGHKKQCKAVNGVNAMAEDEATVHVTTMGFGAPNSKEMVRQTADILASETKAGGTTHQANHQAS
jgi:hypothetical protein